MMITAIPSRLCRSAISSRIWAWTVTSSAVVGSSAISSLGSLASAIAIIARWRMPPENSCGYWSTRLRGSGIPTSSSSSIARSRATPLDTLAVSVDRLGDLAADLVERMQRRQRILEDHRDVVAADPAELLAGERQQVGALEQDLARHAAGAAVGQPHRRQRGDGLARAGLADDPQRRGGGNRVGDSVDGMDDAVVGVELDPQVLDVEQWRRIAHEYRTRGSMNAYMTSTTRLAITMKNAPSSTVPWIIGRSPTRIES